MRVPLSWLKEYVDITVPIEELAYRLTMAGMEVEEIEYLGLPVGELARDRQKGVKVAGDPLVWDREKLVIGHALEIKPHPNADKLVLAMVDSGIGVIETCVTGAPNLHPYSGKGPLNPPLVVAYAREGAEVIDGHKEDGSRMVLKPKVLRGIENKTMVCSAKELGLSDDHEGVLLLDSVAAPGTPLQDVLGDAVFEVNLTPNMARNFSILGIAREVAAITGATLRQPKQSITASSASIEGRAKIEIRDSELNPRFTLALIEGVEIKPSPWIIQHRLQLMGMRPINNIVDVTNYVMLETGQPLHAFDYDVLVDRAGGKAPTIITRLPAPGERLTTLDGVDRSLDPFTILVCDEAGALSLGGIMGGAESEVYDASGFLLDATGISPEGEGEALPHGKAEARPHSTTRVLLEAASWNYINIRQTLSAQRERNQEIRSEAATRFSRGIHPAQAEIGLRRAIEMMRELGGGEIAAGIIDEYPLPEPVVTVELPMSEVQRIVGIDIPRDEVAAILRRLGFGVEEQAGDSLHVTAPDHRLDIGHLNFAEDADIAEVIARADLCEEIARIYGYDRIPDTLLVDGLPPQRSNPALDREEQARDLLLGMGLSEAVCVRLTTPEREALLTPVGMDSGWPGGRYVTLKNPISADRIAMRHTLLSGLLDVLADNMRWQARAALFEIGAVYLPVEGEKLPAEPLHLGIVMTGDRRLPAWDSDPGGLLDFFDLKGVIEGLLEGLHAAALRFTPARHSSFYPGRAATLWIGDQPLGTLGQLHPQVAQAYELPDQPVLAAELDLSAIIAAAQPRHGIEPLSNYPAVYQDIAVIVDESMPADKVEAVIRKAGGTLLRGLRLFDVYRSEQIGAGKKSLAYALTIQAPDKTLRDQDADKQRARILRALESECGASLRG